MQRTPSDASTSADSPPLAQGSAPLLVVGLGASAGGVEALEEFFAHVTPDSGMAFVVTMHQRAGRPSLLSEILARRSAMPVTQVSESTPLEPDHIYTCAPGYALTLSAGILEPAQTDHDAPTQTAVDFFFRSLAADQRERAVGIVLSGMGNDGAVGIKAIKGALGLVMAQEEHSAKYGAMPHSAIATDLVDYVLPVAEIFSSRSSRPRHRAKARDSGSPLFSR